MSGREKSHPVKEIEEHSAKKGAIRKKMGPGEFFKNDRLAKHIGLFPRFFFLGQLCQPTIAFSKKPPPAKFTTFRIIWDCHL